MNGSSDRARRILEEEIGGLFQPAAGVEQHLFARDLDAHAEVVVRLQIFDDHVGKVMHIDDHFANSKGAQAREGDLQQRAPGDFHQRFGTIVGERTQARAQAGGQNHRFHWLKSLQLAGAAPPPPRRSCPRRCFANCSAR